MKYRALDILQEAKQILQDNNILSNRDEWFLLEHTIGTRLNSNMDMQISEEQYNEFMSFVRRRALNEPMDSIIGYTEFLGLRVPFSVHTLTPRQETEIMVDAIIRENSLYKNLKVLDMCCGSGCIGVALSKNLEAEVTLVDISPDALDCSNQLAIEAGANVQIIESNLFDNVQGKFDIIVSNPPYIPSSELDMLEIEVKEYDPILALDGGVDGLDFYRKLVRGLDEHLNVGGRFYFEFGINQGGAILKMLEGKFEDLEIVKDYSGIERYIKGKKIC